MVRNLRALASLASLLSLAGTPGDAGARKLQMSGTWALRTGQVFVPLQFAVSNQQPFGSWTSMGDLSMALGFPNGPVPGAGAVTATGAAPQDLVIPAHRFASEAWAVIPLAGLSLVQISTMLAVDAPHATATLRAGSGPGSFTWCPSDPACLDPPGPDPVPGGPGSNGRIVYRAGANRFGGTLQLGLSGSAVLSLLFATLPTDRFAHHSFAFGPGPVAAAVGGAYATTRTVVPAPLSVTQIAGYHSVNGLILYPGPRVTTMAGVTTTCAPGCGPPLVPPAFPSSTHVGFPATTGTVLVQQTTGTGGDEFFTVMGSDMRSALGAGNLSLVAGGLARRHMPNGTRSFVEFQRVWLALAPSAPSLGPSGLAAAGALVLLGAGYALRGGSRITTGISRVVRFW